MLATCTLTTPHAVTCAINEAVNEMKNVQYLEHLELERIS